MPQPSIGYGRLAARIVITSLIFVVVVTVAGCVMMPGMIIPVLDVLSGSLSITELASDELMMPFVLLVLFGVPFLAYIVGFASRDSTKRRGLCSRCGYDLRGTMGHECPECGGEALPSQPSMGAMSRYHRLGVIALATVLAFVLGVAALIMAGGGGHGYPSWVEWLDVLG